MKNTSDLVIETHGLSKAYKNVQALKSLDLKVAKHSIFGFLGPNGAGKTTTIKLLLGLARPTSGTGSIFGCDIQRQSVQIRRRVGYLAQDPRYYESMTARDTLHFTLGFFSKGPKNKFEERIEETIELVGLADKADRPIRGFSGGERQRLGIAQAQVNYPDLLILDEPAASLDPMGRHDVLEVMERLRKYTTIFYSTHILDDVQRVSDTVCILNRGELVAEAPIQELLAGSGKVLFRLQTRGDIEQIQSLITSQPWVTGVKVEQSDGRAEWQVTVNDANAAEDQLLGLAMTAPGVKVTSFCQSKFDLEDVFMNLVGGNSHGKQ
ncbi:MAG: ABC transporter ATP-binding protein [Anaerolineales bacterium]